MKNRMNKLAGKMNSMMICAHAALTDRRGEGYVDTAVKILMAVARQLPSGRREWIFTE